MSYQLACQLSDKIAAIAPVSAATDQENCFPSRPVPVIHIHGKQDPCALYDGGEACGGCFQKLMKRKFGNRIKSNTAPCEGAVKLVETWVQRNRLSGASEITYKSENAYCETFGPGEPGEVTFCTVEDGGHSWPGGNPPACREGTHPQRCQNRINATGNFSNSFSANDAIWEFFEKHTLK